ncbi:MAG: 5'-methylthioadenosine/adenosylhomocysteine nucleosidase [Anaerolineae bacterium]
MVIAVVAALKEEIEPLVEAMDDVQASKWGKRSIHEGVIGDSEVVAVACGVGKVKAAACTQHLIDRFSVEAVICTGVAGAVNPRLGIGDIVISRRALQHDFELGDPDLVKKLRRRWLKADPRLMDLAAEAGEDLGFEDRIHVGTVLTGDQAITSPEKRQWLWENFGGDCVDMEGAAMAQVCHLNSTPFLVVRAISDFAAENSIAEFKRSFAQTAADAARVVLATLERVR